MIRVRNFILISLIIILGFSPIVDTAQAQEPVVHAVLFYSPTCGHCAQIIENVLPELDRQYGSQLVIYGVNTYSESGSALFASYVELFNVPDDRQAVPTLVVGDQVLLGSSEIPDLFPGIIEEGLKNGGIDWPAIAGLIEDMESSPEGTTEETQTIVHEMTVQEKFKSDLAGNILSVIVLVGMIVSLIITGVNLTKDPDTDKKGAPEWLIPLLSVIGIGIAGYLAYVELNQVEAVCGPVGNCNTVQQSEYATLFGILPIGVMGVMGYLVIIILWLARLLDLPGYTRILNLGLFGITLFGLLFSIYLTFLEPFVIGATCIWCLSSAVIMTILFLLAAGKLNDPI
ncbi:MAG: vitamin K epoxide reductase [Chloroflexota bacterium]|nr:MAG: vitamin K epoxide reductase [Chloroflexota bacterium]HDD62331.1 vitamin K epoxide reductase [Chloroflexota bacterium]